MNEKELNQRMRAACNPERDTDCHAKAVQLWNAENGYNGEFVPYLQMTLKQRMDVNRIAQQLKEAL